MVEWKKLGDICEVQRGKRLTKNLLDEKAAYPVYHGGLDPLGRYGQYNREANTVMVINVGASAGTVGFCNCRFWSSDGCFCISHSELLDNKYLFYYLQTKTHYLQSQVRHAGIPTLDNPIVEKIMLPLLSLSEQQRIAEQLDTFTSSIENLKEQIAQRRKQYEYYRDQLLDLEGKEGVEMKKLEDIVSKECSLSYGIVQPGDDIHDGIPVVRPVDLVTTFIFKRGLKNTTKEISDSYKRTILKGNEILFCVRGTTGIMSLATQELFGCNVTRGIVPISFDNEITKKFVYYQLKTRKQQNVIADKTNGTALKQINIKDLRQIKLLVPSLSEQQRIVSILDTFEASISNLEQQLAQREKQYEYYRNKLLTFE